MTTAEVRGHLRRINGRYVFVKNHRRKVKPRTWLPNFV